MPPRNVINVTVRKTVTTPIRNWLFFFYRSFATYSREVANTAINESLSRYFG